MSKNISSLLFYPFEKGQLDDFNFEAKTLFWNAQYFPDMMQFGNHIAVQSFKADADILENYKVKNSPEFIDGKYKNIFCVLPKQKEASFYMLARCLDALEDSGLLMAVAANDAGGKNIEKWLKQLGVNPTSLSKNKCRIVWAYKNEINQEKIEHYIDQGSPKNINVQDYIFTTQVGIFGWNKIDKGSQILTQYLPDNLSGIGADFGCGYGYLSDMLLQKSPKIKKLYMLEADYNALECAKINLKKYEDNFDLHYDWIDLTQEKNIPKNLDWIVMNPPFHEGKKANNVIGVDFIVNASNALKKNGRLYMVANVHLPYDKTLEYNFSTVEKLYEENGFKVFVATK